MQELFKSSMFLYALFAQCWMKQLVDIDTEQYHLLNIFQLSESFTSFQI